MAYLKHTLLTAVSVAAIVETADAGVLTGRVSGAADGNALPGALVRVVETGQEAASGTSGQFRIGDLAAGTYTIEVQYLGYQTGRQEVTVSETGVVNADIRLGQQGAMTLDTVVVRGTALGLNKALNEQRTEDTITNIVSADMIGKFPDNNVAESVSRLPGITLVRDQQTGEGAFVTIRGLDSRLNAYSLNGVRIATSDQNNRAINLAQLPADGLSSVKVSKTLTPDMDGDAIGGSVDFRTPSAFDFDGRSASLSLTGTYNDRAEDGGYDLSGSFSDFLVDDKVGLYVTAYYEEKNSIGQESENEGDWLPFNRPASDEDTTVDPASFQMQGLGLDLFENDLERFGGNFTLDYKFNDGSQIYLRGQFSQFTDREDHHYIDVQNDDEVSILNQVDPGDTTLAQPSESIIGYDPALGNIYSYTPAQIIDTDGDGIITDFDKDEPVVDDDGFYTLGGQSGIWDPGRIIFQRGADFKEETETLYSLNTGGEHFRDDWTLDWDVAYSYGEFERPYDYDFDFDDTGAQRNPPFTGIADPRDNNNPYPGAGVTFAFPEPQYPQWQLTPAQRAAYFDPASYTFDGAGGDVENHTDENILLQANIRRDFSDFGPLTYVSFGAKYRKKTHETNEDELFDGDEQDITLADVPQIVASETYGDFLSGQYSGNDDFGFVFDRNAALAAIRECDPVFFEDCSGFSEEIGSDTVSEEAITAAYAMAAAQWGKLEVIGGVRVEDTQVDNEYNSFTEFEAELADGTEFGDIEFVEPGSDSASYTNVLPSVHFNYRQSDRLVYRGAIWSSIARPSYDDISAEENVEADVIVDADGNILSFVEDSISLERGNPGLEPAEAVNFDLGAEYYSPNGGLASVNFFYKDITNFIFSDFANEGDVPTVFEGESVSFEAIKNGGDAYIYGVEFGLTQQLTALPAPFDGFGFSGNVTLQRSEAEPGDDWRSETDFINAPETQFNGQIFYEKYGFEGRLSYQYTDRFIEDLRDYGVNKWIHDWDRLDAQVRYTLGNGVTVRGEVQNILDGHNYWAIRGENGDSFQKDYVENGRTFYLGIDYRF